ncbi:MAG: hypothetical protein NTW06_00495 [Candidatus Falkowbacteria bacterium]|nr:hypothetical protein [Candidatus Falkowbacteria bacterium]
MSFFVEKQAKEIANQHATFLPSQFSFSRDKKYVDIEQTIHLTISPRKHNGVQMICEELLDADPLAWFAPSVRHYQLLGRGRRFLQKNRLYRFIIRNIKSDEGTGSRYHIIITVAFCR